MDDGHDNTAVDIANLLESPKPSPQQPLSQPTVQETSLEEILASSTELVHTFAASINHSAMREATKTDAFRREFKRRLFRAVINTYVWSTARLAHETETAEGRLGKDVQELLLADREQDRLRARLSELMAAVSRAVEMFAQF